MRLEIVYRGLREAFLLTLIGINSDTMSPARGAVYLQGEALECSLCSHRARTLSVACASQRMSYEPDPSASAQGYTNPCLAAGDHDAFSSPSSIFKKFFTSSIFYCKHFQNQAMSLLRRGVDQKKAPAAHPLPDAQCVVAEGFP